MGEIVPTTWFQYKRALRRRTEAVRELGRAAAAMRRLAALAPHSGSAELAQAFAALSREIQAIDPAEVDLAQLHALQAQMDTIVRQIGDGLRVQQAASGNGCPERSGGPAADSGARSSRDGMAAK